MGSVLQRLVEKGLLLSDGAWGTELIARGLKPEECPEEWNVSHPEAVRGVAAAYAAAGCDLVLSNTFGGSALKLKKKHLEGRLAELNRAGARLSAEGAPDAVVAASIGPTGEFLEPYGELSVEELEAAFTAQIAAVLEGGAHAVCIETMSAVEEAACAIRAAKKLQPSLDVIATMTFDPTPKGYRTMMGVTPARAAELLGAAGADIVGANCGNGIEQMVEIVALMRPCTGLPILVHANAGKPQLVDGKAVFLQKPEDFAARVQALVDAGARIVGGCCGTTPAHMSAMKRELDKLRKR